MKTYSANQELENILLKFGFIETTDKRNQLKGKKEFRLSKYSQKKIYFDYINIIVVRKFSMHSLGTEISLEELAIILLYFHLKADEQKKVFIDGIFNLESAKRCLESIESEYNNLIEFNLHKSRRERLKRILDLKEDFGNKIING